MTIAVDLGRKAKKTNKQDAMVVECHHVACVRENETERKSLSSKKKIIIFFFEDLGFFFSKLAKKSPTFHCEWGRNFGP